MSKWVDNVVSLCMGFALFSMGVGVFFFIYKVWNIVPCSRLGG